MKFDQAALNYRIASACDSPKAFADALAALEQVPPSSDYEEELLCMKMDCLIRLRRWTKLIELTSALIKKDKVADPNVWIGLITGLASSLQHGKALESADKALSVWPDDPHFIVFKARIQALREEWDQVDSLLVQYHELDAYKDAYTEQLASTVRIEWIHNLFDCGPSNN
ncbi:hypothetical protein [Pelagicoccus mobilis]|uniref:Tetratricopeptide repeat protein n=1 Tax=Pelagicoccus mobilis TaxID=415221 RepID=A0A934S0H3_9BACT|nr:hypothetical protein [Pelagicoccus mobilis]MBK1877209.1 hypothetical protein [Pelagicoccus mobilis]